MRKNILKTGNRENILLLLRSLLLKIYLNRKRWRIIKDWRLKLLQTGSWKLWSLERSPYWLLLTGGSRECRQLTGENSTVQVLIGAVLTAHLCTFVHICANCDCTFVQSQFTTMQCYAVYPTAGGEGANSATPDLLAGFWGEEGKG